MGMVRIEIDGNEAAVYSPYDPQRIEIIKSCPGRSWDSKGKCWHLPADQVPRLTTALEAYGDTVMTHGAPPKNTGNLAELARLELENQRLRQDIQRMRNEAAARSRNWAEHLLGKLTPGQAERAYKRLASVVHPDAGGNTDLMTDLNVAFDLLAERSNR